MSNDLQVQMKHDTVSSQLNEAINLSLTIGEASKRMKYNEEAFINIARIVAQQVPHVVSFYKSMISYRNENGVLGIQDEDIIHLSLLVNILRTIHKAMQKAASRNVVMGWLRSGSDAREIRDYKLTLEMRYGCFKMVSDTYMQRIVRRAIDSSGE